jgi:hypothetical protein
MKKTLLVIALVCAALGAVSAQEGAGGAAAATMSDVSLLNLNTYSSLFLNGGGRVDSKYSRVASSEDRGRFRELGGDPALTDTPLEIALLSTCAGVVDVRPVEASRILGDAKQADLKLGSAVLKELTELKFLDPNNRDAVGRYEGILTFITDRGNATRAEIESYYRQGIGPLIAEAVDAEFNKVRFMVKTNTDGANVELIRNSNEYILICDGFWGNPKKEEIKQFSASSLDALLAVMRNSGDFSATAFNVVRAQAALIPATNLDTKAISDITELLVNLYTRPTDPAAYNMVKAVFALYQNLELRSSNDIFKKITTAYDRTLYTLSVELEKKIVQDWLQQKQAYTTLSTVQQQRLLPNLQQR